VRKYEVIRGVSCTSPDHKEYEFLNKSSHE
jgi:hypothetical protein